MVETTEEPQDHQPVTEPMIFSKREPLSESVLRDNERLAKINDAISTASAVLQKFYDIGWPDIEGARAKLNSIRPLIR